MYDAERRACRSARWKPRRSASPSALRGSIAPDLSALANATCSRTVSDGKSTSCCGPASRGSPNVTGLSKARIYVSCWGTIDSSRAERDARAVASL